MIPPTIRLCWAASRPAQLLLIVWVYGLGVGVAVAVDGYGSGTAGPGLVGLAALVPTAASVHYVNEYADHETDALTDRTPFSGGSGALQATGADRSTLLRAALGALAVGLAATVAGVATGWLPRAAAELLAVIAVLGWGYSVGPRLAWRGLGELDNAALGGLLLPAYGAAAVGGPVGRTAVACLPFALVVFLNLLATQWPDRAADGRVGKDTLAVRWSARRLRRTYLAVAVLAGVAVVALHPAVLPTPVAAASAVAVPFLVAGAAGYTRRSVPWPTVTGMVALSVAQSVAWWSIAVG